MSFRSLNEDYYYHGTSAENAKSVLKHGVDPSKSRYGSKTFLTRSYGEAHKYGKIASGGKIPVVLKVHHSALDQKHIDNNHSGIVQYSGKIEPHKISTV